MNMVLSVLVAIIAAPALLGSQEAIRQSQSKEKREEHRARRCNLIATCVKSSLRSREISGRPVVLRNGKLYVDTGTSNGAAFGHQYAGYYLPYPDSDHEGLVTTITEEAPIMNWVFIDKDTYEVKYDVRANAQPNITGPFDCTRQDRRLTFDGWEGWCAVEESPTLWALYFDKDDNGLQGKIVPGTRVLEIELSRKEKRWKKEVNDRQQDQTTKREVDSKEDAPVDNTAPGGPEIKPPGLDTNLTPLDEVEASCKEEISMKMPATIFPDEAPLPLPQSIFAEDSSVEATPPIDIEESPTTMPRTIRPGEPPLRLPTFSTLGEDMRAPERQNIESTDVPAPEAAAIPPSLRSSPARGKPGRLNRNSRSRALAQAQMFEAMSQRLSGTTPQNGRSPSRPNSSDDAASNSSNRNSTDVLQAYLERPDSSTLTPSTPALFPPQSKSLSPVADPAIWSGFTGARSPNSPESTRPLPNTSANRQNPLARKEYFSARTNSEPPKVPLPPVPMLPVESSGGNRERRPPTNLENRRMASPEARRGNDPQVNPRRAQGPPRSDSRYLAFGDMRQRGDSAYSQNSDAARGSPRPLGRATTTSAPKSSPSRLFRSGSSSQSLVPSVPKGNNVRTTSSLYRELDDILKLEGTTSLAAKIKSSPQNRSGDRRPPPLSRTATEGRRNEIGPRRPLQRTLTTGGNDRRDRDHGSNGG